MSLLRSKYRIWSTRCVLIVLALSPILITTSLLAQDPVYSQFYNAPLELNPAFAGNSYTPTIALNYRNQWPGVSNTYQTYSASYDQYLNRYNSGIGFNILSDNAGNGAIKTTKISGLYSYKLKVNDELNLKIGLEAAAIQTRLDWASFSFPDQIDPEFGAVSPGGIPFPTSELQPDDTSSSFLDISTGLLLYNPLFYAGMTFNHITNPDNSFLESGNNVVGLPFRFSMHGGMQINLDRGNKKDEGAFITPNVLYVKQADFSQLILGAYGSVRSFFVGGWYRHAFSNPDAVIATVGMRAGIFKIGYSYDFTVSDLSINTGGSHELGILINFESITSPPSELNDCLKLFR